MRVAKWIVPVLCGLAASLAAGEDFWMKKPYQQWSAEEAGRMLEDSPWATTRVLTAVNLTKPIINGQQDQASNTVREDVETEPTIVYTLQFRSAAPIREAMVRSSQLRSRYDAMSADQKAAFDANASKFLTATFPDHVVVTVTFRSNSQNYQSLLRVYWASQDTAKMHIATYLNAGKDRLPPESYAFKDDTFQCIFPRPKQLRPDSQVSVEFVHPRIDRIRQERVFLEFKLKKMLVNGEPAL